MSATTKVPSKVPYRRILGLSSRALLVTAQRFLDVNYIITHADASHWSWEAITLFVALLLTTVLMAHTTTKHWSMLRQNRPHGPVIGIVTAILQISPLWEMFDKLLLGEKPHDGLEKSENLECLLRSDLPKRDISTWTRPPKGSPGENVMRGARKMCMVNLLEAMASLFISTRDILPVTGDINVQTTWTLGFAFVTSFFCVAFGIADFILYIWVHDAFVRNNKKLVTLHYCVEILARVPALVIFHVTFSRLNNYIPSITLFTVDVLLTSGLLMASRFQNKRCGFCCAMARETVTQFLYSLVMSVILFLVNVVFFDPGMSFFYVNQVFYMIKYVEIGVMLHLVDQCSLAGVTIDRPDTAIALFWYIEIVLVVVSGFLAWIYIPYRRREITDLGSGFVPPSPTKVTVTGPHPYRKRSLSDDSGLLNTSAMCDQRRGQMLERLEEIFEMFWLLSKANCTHNRMLLLGVIVNEFWFQVLQWKGYYTNGRGETIRINIDKASRIVSIYTLAPERESRNVAGSESSTTGNVVDGMRLVVTAGNGCTRSGRFNGQVIRWDNGEIWTKQGAGNVAKSHAHQVLRLILPQLALALRWDNIGGTRALDAALGEDCAELACGVDIPDLNCRPLLNFLLQYALLVQDQGFISDLYWALYCLSAEKDPDSQTSTRGYREARLALLQVLRGKGDDEHAEFLDASQQSLRGQREVWRQQVELLTNYTGRQSGEGSAHFRTQKLRNALRRWPELRRKSQDQPDEDDALLSPSGARGVVSGDRQDDTFDLVSPVGLQVTTPIDPTVAFRGVIIEESEVIPSKRAPVILVCRTSPPLGKSRVVPTASSTREKYLIKVGDDLRQDQLMLQIMALMACVWEEQLCEADATLLNLASFRVLAMTPTSGYVKCVQEAVPLSEALHEARGDLIGWLDRNHPHDMTRDQVMDNLCGSVAACCVVTYVLGIGDRHFENIMITRQGEIFHIDFGFVLGDDPKPCAPPVRLPQQIAQALVVTERLSQCFALAGKAYCVLRPFAGLWCSILQFTAASGGAGCTKLARSPSAAISGVRERLCVDQTDETRAAAEFLGLMRESSEGLASILMDKVHAAGLYWR